MASCDQGQRNWFWLLLWVVAVGCIFPTRHMDSVAPNTSYEIVIPRRLEPEAGEAKKEELSYILKVAGKEHIIRLNQKNHFLVGNLPVFTYESGGQRVKSHPYIPSDCYYRGYVEGVADSLVALSTCIGLTGFLQIRDRDYNLEPLRDSQTFQHLLYLTHKPSWISTGGPRADDANRQAEEAGRGKPKVRFANDLLYIELYAVVDSELFVFLGGNETGVQHRIWNTINLVYTQYRSQNFEVVLVGLDIWKEGNPIEIPSDSKNATDNFSGWKIAHEKEVERDVTHLYINRRFYDEPLGSYLGGICKRNLSVWIVSYEAWSLYFFSMRVSHGLGHNLGLDHDGPNCLCEGETYCIMNTASFRAMFSTCSVASLSRLRRSRDLDCLYNIPPSAFKLKQCGDKVVDAGEQCDCGDQHQCKQDPCCHPNCTLKAKAACAHEDCCENCQLTPKGELCRNKANLCDLPEYCTGKSMQCPEDVYLQDGSPCGTEAYCFAKQCSTHHLHCTAIFGGKASVAPQSCFKALNMAGDHVGNCGGDEEGGKYVKCQEKDILCGRLHCSNVEKKLSPLSYTESLVNGVSCWSTKYQPGRGRGDKGAVPDGTTCSKEKICMNRTCVPVSILKSDCDPAETCHGKGVCNNRKHCHCEPGWAPPDCKHSGIGGSVDSGPPVQAYSKHMVRFAFKFIIPIVLVVLVVAYFVGSRVRGFLTPRESV